MHVPEWNSLKVWVTAGHKTVSEELIDLDEQARLCSAYLTAPKGLFLSIHIKLGKRSPCTSDFVIGVSLDGPPLHPIPLKRNNNTESVVDGWFAHDEEDNMLARIPFMLGRVPRTDDVMQHNMLPRDDILGTIRIDVYQAQLGKSSTAYPYTFFPDLHAHRADDLRNDLCIAAGGPIPCEKDTAKSLYRIKNAYKANSKKPWVSFQYHLKEREGDREDFESKAAVNRQIQREGLDDQRVGQLENRMKAMETEVTHLNRRDAGQSASPATTPSADRNEMGRRLNNATLVPASTSTSREDTPLSSLSHAGLVGARHGSTLQMKREPRDF